MKARHEECWLPTPGSWEEAVEPYDAQFVNPRDLFSGETSAELLADMRIDRNHQVPVVVQV